MKKFLLIFAFTFLVAVNVYALPIVTNGNFETITDQAGLVNKINLKDLSSGEWDVYKQISGWTSGDGTSGIELQYNPVVINSRSPFLHVELDSHGGTDTNSSMYQMVDLAVGTYELSFWYHARTNTFEDNSITASIAGKSVIANWKSSEQDADWDEFTLAFSILEAGEYKLDFTATGLDNSRGGLIDDVAINPVPEPATMMLFGLGLLGLAGVSRKKTS